jgi:hypothetical protein
MTRSEIIKRLRNVSEELKDLGTAIDYYYGFNPLSQRGRDMVGYGVVAGQLVEEMEKDNAVEGEHG